MYCEADTEAGSTRSLEDLILRLQCLLKLLQMLLMDQGTRSLTCRLMAVDDDCTSMELSNVLLDAKHSTVHIVCTPPLISVQAEGSGEAAPGLGAFAFLAWAGPQQELRLHSDEAHASQQLLEATCAALEAYESPLLTFHTYRWVQAARCLAALRLMCGGSPSHGQHAKFSGDVWCVVLCC